MLVLFFSLSYGVTKDNYWFGAIDSALNVRNQTFNQQAIESATQIIPIDNAKKEQILSRLDFAIGPNAWIFLIKGFLLSDNNPTASDSLFRLAINTSQNDPGTTWLLFVEFTRYEFSNFADSSMMSLYKQLTSSGSDASAVISLQLKYLAKYYSEQKNFQVTNRLYNWIEKFDPDQTWSHKRRFFQSFPGDIDGMKVALFTYISTMSRSWVSQTNLLSDNYFWIHTFFTVLLFSLFALISIKYFPLAVHHVSDLYPLSVSSTLRTLLASLIVISTLFFGVNVFFWLTSILVWPHVDKKDKSVLLLAILILILSPLDTRIRVMSDSIKDPEGSIVMLKKSISDGVTDEFFSKLTLKYSNNKDNPYFISAIAIASYKKGDLAFAQQMINKALALKNNDPVITVMAGNIAFQKGDYVKANEYFQKAVSLPDRDVSALFNLGQCYLMQKQTLPGTESIDKAAKEDNLTVNSFIQQNDMLYSDNWPSIRKLMIPDFTASYFWKNVFFRNNGSWQTANERWGTSFIGFNALTSFFIFILLFITLLLVSFFKAPSRIKKLFECKYCGRISCKKCAHGILCCLCDHQIAYITTDKKLDKIRISIIGKFAKVRFFREMLIDMLFPGSSRFLNSKKSSASSIFLLSITSIVYSGYLFLIRRSEENSIGVDFYLILALLLVYNIVFILRRAGDIQRFLKTSSKSQM
ncbi:MAG: tetratricopeptide repeat protein [Fibrobacterota bacterium]